MELREAWERLDELAALTACPENKKKTCGCGCCSPVKSGLKVLAAPRELAAIRAHFGERPLPSVRADPCMFLAGDGTCSIYSVRPLECRAYTCADDEHGERAAAISEIMSKYNSANPEEGENREDLRWAFKPPNPYGHLMKGRTR